MIILTVIILGTAAFAGEIVVGEKPPVLVLDGRQGGRLDNSAWSSEELQDKVWCLFYVDPDESDLNVAAEDSLSAEDIPDDKLQTAAVINYKATILPGFAVSMVLRGKQKDHPNTLYLKDNKHVFVDEWGLTDDTYCTLVFDKDGVLVYRKDGKMNDGDIEEYISVIKANL
jgi:hypothetical protein